VTTINIVPVSNNNQTTTTTNNNNKQKDNQQIATTVANSHACNMSRQRRLSFAILITIFLLCNYTYLISKSFTSVEVGVDLSILPSSLKVTTTKTTSKTTTTDYYYSQNTKIRNETTSSTKDIKEVISTSNILQEKFLSNKSSSSRVGFHIFRRPEVTNSIIILGERHSGTTFFTKYLQDCFPNVTVKDTLINNKHWLQPDPEYLLNVVNSESEADDQTEISSWRDIVKNGISNKNQKSNHLRKYYFENSLVIALFRNPYDW
jgi:hypothetical protein